MSYIFKGKLPKLMEILRHYLKKSQDFKLVMKLIKNKQRSKKKKEISSSNHQQIHQKKLWKTVKAIVLPTLKFIESCSYW